MIRAGRSDPVALVQLVAVIAAGVLFASVATAQPAAATNPALARQVPDPRKVLDQYATLVHAAYADALTSARAMQQAVDAFVATPGAQTHDAAKRAWLAAREWYGRTEAFRFYGGPIDGRNGPEPRINAWPMDEAYVDGVKGKPGAGFINRPAQPVTRAALTALNEKGGEVNISTGWHAIEFMLWGQDLDANGPGARSFEEFVDGKAPNAARRRQYLKTVTDLLIDDLAGLVRAWAPNQGGSKASAQKATTPGGNTPKGNGYRAAFVANPGNLAKVLTGIGVLTRGELAGERMEVALDSRDQEDEHSCFSDNTHRDIVNNVIGIRNVWRGEAARLDGTTVNGPGVRDLVAARDAEVAASVDRQIDASLKAVEAILAPFDREIAGSDDAPGRQRVRAAVEALKAQADGLVRSAQVLGIKRLNTAVPK